MSQVEALPHDFELSEPWMLEDLAVEAFGADDPVAMFKGEIELRLGNRPVARSVRSLFELAEKKLPPEIAALKGETYLIAHAIGVAAKKGAGRVDSVQLRASFAGAGTTIDLVPNTAFKEFVKAGLKFEAGLGADGYAKVPTVGVPDLGQLVTLGAGAELKLSAEASVVGNLSVSLATPKIQAVGRSSTIASWQIDKQDQPLVGDQVLVQTVTVPKGQESIGFTLQAIATIDPGFFALRKVPIQTKPTEVTVELG
jgi:hypothetical protein